MFVRPAGLTSVSCDKNFDVGHYMQTVHPFCFLSTMFIGTIDFYFIQLSPIMTLPRGHMISVEQNLLASHSCSLLLWSGWNLMWWWSNSSWTSWIIFEQESFTRRGITAVLLTASKTSVLPCIWTFSNQFDSVWYDNRYYCPLHFDATITSLINLDLDSRSQECEKANTSMPITSQSFQLTWMEAGILLRLSHVMNLILLYFIYSIFKGEDPTVVILFLSRVSGVEYQRTRWTKSKKLFKSDTSWMGNHVFFLTLPYHCHVKPACFRLQVVAEPSQPVPRRGVPAI